MFTRRFTPYLVVAGILALLSASYLCYRAYQSHVDFKVFISQALSFQQTIDKETMPGQDSTDKQMEQKGDNSAAPTSGLATDQTGHDNTHGEEISSPPVKVRLLPPELVAVYSSEGDSNAAIRLANGPTPDIPEKTWTEAELVSQEVELPDGEVVNTLVIPGLEFQEADRVSLQYIENARDKRHDYIEVDGVRYDASTVTGDDDYSTQKMLWASSMDIPMKELESLIANREFFVTTEDEPLTTEERDINFKFLSKIPEFRAYVRAHRPNLLEMESPPDSAYQSSENREISGESDVSSYLRQLPLESEPAPQGKAGRQLPVRSDLPPVSSQEIDNREGLSPERLGKVQQLIDQYGSEEGLRRFREMDPEAARQFERGRKPPPTRDEPETR